MTRVICLFISFLLLAAASTIAAHSPTDLNKDPEYIKLYGQFQKLQIQLVEAEKDLGRIYKKYLENPPKDSNLMKNPFYKKSWEKRERIFIELSKVMEKMSEKARKASGSEGDMPKAPEIPNLAPSPKPYIHVNKAEVNLTYPKTKALENRPKTE